MKERTPVVVAKFGGTSMARPKRVADIVASRQDHAVVVVSAPGKAEGYSEKMTDKLIRLAGYATQMAKYHERFCTETNQIINRFSDLYSDIGERQQQLLRTLARQCFASIQQQENPETYAMSLGEELSARYFTELLGTHGLSARYIDPRQWVVFRSEHILDRQTTIQNFAHITQVLAQDETIIVTPGFYGFDTAGNRQLLGRGGSDRTGALAAAGLARSGVGDSVLYENWTDQDGVKTADPRVVPHARVIDMLTHKEAHLCSKAGSCVLHEAVLDDLAGSDVNITVRNTFNTKHCGTQVVPDRQYDTNESVVTISGKKCKTIRISNVIDQVGCIIELDRIIGTVGISYDIAWLPNGELLLAFSDTISPHSLHEIKACLNAWNDVADVSIAECEDQGIVHLVGEALRDQAYSKAVMDRVQRRIKTKSALFLNCTSTPGIAFLIEPDTIEYCMQILHKEFFELNTAS